MELNSYFADFLAEIRPTSSQKEDYRNGHQVLRDRLCGDKELGHIIVSTFIQGSYRRATAVRPEGDDRPDVDVVVVTKLDKDKYTPSKAMGLFIPFLDKYYKGKYRIQGRSLGITLSYVDLDLVITSAPSEIDQEALRFKSVTSEDTPEDVGDWRLTKSWRPLSERDSTYSLPMLEAARKEKEWQLSPLYIPDRETKQWEPTHPLAQIKWTWDKNSRCNGNYVNVVKAIKWWRRVNHPTPKRPKGYPLEHLIGVCCPDGVTSVAQGVTLTLESIASEYPQKPFLPDHGVPQHDVMARVPAQDYEAFYSQVCEAAKSARFALDSEDLYESVRAWKELFGDKFPDPPPEKEQGGFTPRTKPSVIGGRRFA